MIKKYFLEKQISITGWLLLLLSGVLLFVISLPHTMALRKLLLLLAFLVALPIFWAAVKNGSKMLLSAVLAGGLLQAWMVIIALFVSERPLASLDEWKGQWLPVFMFFVIGIGVAVTLMRSKLKYPRAAVAAVVLVPTIIYLVINASVITFDLIMTGAFHAGQLGITGEKGVVNFLIALIEPILIADVLGRALKIGRLVPVPNWTIASIFMLALYTLFAASSRNGLIIMMLTLIFAATMIALEVRKKYSRSTIFSFVALLVLLIAIVAFTAYKTDPRWQTFIETIPVAWDIDRDLVWLEGDGSDLPITAGGQPIDSSQYYRIAWAHEGWRMLVAHPWGMEISRDTFHDLELKKYGRAGMAHAHNGWLDLGLNVGVLGLLLWGGFLFSLARTGWMAWKTDRAQLGLALVIMTVMFAVSGLFDSIFRDHVTQQFALVAGLLFAALLYEKQDEKNVRTK